MAVNSTVLLPLVPSDSGLKKVSGCNDWPDGMSMWVFFGYPYVQDGSNVTIYVLLVA